MSIAELPRALRAVASWKRTLLGRQKRVFRFDALYSNGHVDTDVNAPPGVCSMTGRATENARTSRRQRALRPCPPTACWPRRLHGSFNAGELRERPPRHGCQRNGLLDGGATGVEEFQSTVLEVVPNAFAVG
jgi:hypothetical protein